MKSNSNKSKTPKSSLESVEKLLANPKNARTHSAKQIKKIAKSIDKLGFVNPIIIDSKKVIYAGHGRLEAAKQLDMEEVPCLDISYLSEEERELYMLADNRIATESGWDQEKLNDAFLHLHDMNFDLSITGFEDDEIDKAFSYNKGDKEGEDDVPTIPKKPYSKVGQIYQLGNHRLMCGDSTDAENVKKLMDGAEADMVFTDPPYGVDYDGINNDDREGLENLLDKSFGIYADSTKKGGAVYIFHSDRCADIFHQVFRKYFHFSSMIIWKKNSLTLSQTDYQSIHEPCLYGWEKRGKHKFYGDRKQTSVWECDKESVEGHTTPKPVEIITKALANSSLTDHLVLDLFGGSGSTMIACEKVGRRCNMMEIDPHYVDVIIARWEKYTGEKAVLLEK